MEVYSRVSTSFHEFLLVLSNNILLSSVSSLSVPIVFTLDTRAEARAGKTRVESRWKLVLKSY